MNTLRIDKRFYAIPENYNELSKSKLLKICKLLQTGGETMHVKVALVLLNFSRTIFRSPRSFARLRAIPTEYLTYIAYNPILNWVYAPAALSNYKINCFKFRLKKYYGPYDDMLNISISEFIECSMYYEAYIESLIAQKPDDKLLDCLLAVLFRRARPLFNLEKFRSDFEIDCRQKNNLFRFNKRVKLFTKLKPELKMALFLQFDGAYNSYGSAFPNAFGSKSDTKDTQSWIRLLMTISGGIFGDYEKTQIIDSYTFFTKVDFNIKESKEAEMRLNK